MTEGALSLLAPLAASARLLDGEWRAAYAAQEGGSDGDYAHPGFDDSRWERLALPRLFQSAAGRDTLWYRHRFWFAPPQNGAHTLLRFGGAFYETRVWLNGLELGAHQGYFQPFGFDATSALQVGENTVAVCCRFPVEADAFKRKTAIAGIFSDWDCKPYPSAYYPDLPAPYQWSLPLGLWQPAHLVTTGKVLVEAFNIFPEVISPRWTDGAEAANLRIVLQLRSLAPAAQAGRIKISVAPHNFVGQQVAAGEWEICLEGGQPCRRELTLAIPRPRLWFPWTHGAPHLYRAVLTLEDGDGETSELEQVFGVRALQAEIGAGRWQWALNGRPVFPRGSNYIADFYLDRAGSQGLDRDLELARRANLDLLRVHAHVGPPEFYRLCDERGMLVMCDFPLIWTYAFGLPPAGQAAFQASVEQQVADMVALLGSHPSIVLWSIHNEPPWTPDGSFLGADVHAAQANRRDDESAAARVRAMDSTRPVVAASGLYDQHLYHGWYTGHWSDNRRLSPPFPTEFGVQALPNLDSPFWDTANMAWPVSSDDPGWAYAGFQSVFWASPGVGSPSQFASLAEYVQESQEYQAFYIRYVIDQWRRKKFNPLGGYIHFLFTDGWPAITWSVLDYFRLPKAGYHALGQASNPAHVCVDIADGFTVENAFHLVYAGGASFQAALYLVNDDYRLGGRARLRWWLEPRRGRRLQARLRRWLARGRAVELPPADGPACLVAQVNLPLPRAGEYTFCTRLEQGARVLDENRYHLRVGGAQPRRPAARRPEPRRVPGFLVGRVYEFGSLRQAGSGFSLRLCNPVMPVIIQRLVELCADGQPVDLDRVELRCGGQVRRASTIVPEAPFEFIAGEHLVVAVHGWPLSPGMHELAATCQVFGLGDLTARWRDKLAAGPPA